LFYNGRLARQVKQFHGPMKRKMDQLGSTG
jgi:hypothetical protein